MPEPHCIKCGKPLTWDDVGAHKKLVNRGAESFYCIRCLSEYLGVGEDMVRAKIEEFRASGCTLFPQKEK